MDIILQGQHSVEDVVESLEKVLNLFRERYQIKNFNEIHLSVTLLDNQGDVVELIDSVSNQVFRVFEVYRDGYELSGRQGVPILQLVVDNTK